MPSTTLRDRSPEQASGAWHGQERGHAKGTRRLAKDRDPGRITAEGVDVLLDPFQCGDLVEQTPIRAPVAQVEKAVRSKAVVDGDADDAVTSKPAAIVGWQDTRAPYKSAAVDPDHDGETATARVRRPNVEVEAVFAWEALIAEEAVKGRRIGGLRCDAAILQPVTHGVPRLRRPWRLEPIRSERWRGIWNSLERRHAVADLTQNLALPGRHDNVRSRDAHVGSSLRYGPPVA